MGEDYTSQSRSEFDWYNPHLYNYSHKGGIIHAGFQALMLSSTMAFMWKKPASQIIFYISCGTLICVSIIRQSRS